MSNLKPYSVCDRHRYQMDLGDCCPRCGGPYLHPTGQSQRLIPRCEYGPTVALLAWCECGATVEIRVGNYKGSLSMDVVEITPWGNIPPWGEPDPDEGENIPDPEDGELSLLNTPDDE